MRHNPVEVPWSNSNQVVVESNISTHDAMCAGWQRLININIFESEICGFRTGTSNTLSLLAPIGIQFKQFE